MGTSAVSRREFVKTLAAGLVLADRGHLDRAVSTQPSTLRVAAVQMTADLANVDANLLKVERLTRLAFSRGARWVILPEFFTSGIAFHPDMAKATRAVDGLPAQLLLKLAREGNAVVGGSFLAWRDGNAYNTFVLAFPDGSTLRHDKDYPTMWENCYYVGGKDDGVLPTPNGNVGVALCWEFVRSGTARRLKDRVNMVVGGAGWWTLSDARPADDPYRKLNLDILKAAPGRLARMLGVPVVHASHAGRFEGLASPGEAVAPFPGAFSAPYGSLSEQIEIMKGLAIDPAGLIQNVPWTGRSKPSGERKSVGRRDSTYSNLHVGTPLIAPSPIFLCVKRGRLAGRRKNSGMVDALKAFPIEAKL